MAVHIMASVGHSVTAGNLNSVGLLCPFLFGPNTGDEQSSPVFSLT